MRRALCVSHADGNAGLDARCRGLARAMRSAGGTARVIARVDARTRRTRPVAACVAARRATACSRSTSYGARRALRPARPRRPASPRFDLSPDVLEAVRAGGCAFAVDQQAYLQGYLPIVLLAERARYGLFPASGDVIPTGPNFVTRENAAAVIAQARRGIR